jgi:hypothetical protein
LTVAISTAHGATVSGFYSYGAEPNPGGIEYAFLVTLGGTDNASIQRHVGAWSWEDDSLFGPGDDPVGWTHTSDWVALTLTEATTFTLRLEAQAGVPWPSSEDPGRVASTASMRPSFSIYQGWDNDIVPDLNDPILVAAWAPFGGVPPNLGDHHTFNNDGAIFWAEDLTYFDHVNNSTATFVEKTWTLPAGQYSISLGSNSTATDTDRQGYRATFTSVPEPTTAATLIAGFGVLALRRRRLG